MSPSNRAAAYRSRLGDRHAIGIDRLAAQLAGLERRTARSGKDSIDHTPGGHDDLANAVAGVLVGLDLDHRSALLRTDDLLIAGAPAPVPAVVDGVFATVLLTST